MIGISVLISSRLRTIGLERAISSFLCTAKQKDALEFIVRADNDDLKTIESVLELQALHWPVRLLVGKKTGHKGHAARMWEMAQLATGTWLMDFNDDAWMHSSCIGWDEELYKVEVGDTVVFPDRVPHDTRPWGDDEVANFPILPNKWWVQFGITKFEYPTDLSMVHLLCYGGWMETAGKGWRRHILKGCSIVHEQKYDKLVDQDPDKRTWDDLDAKKAEYERENARG